LIDASGARGQASWNSPTGRGCAAYKVGDGITGHAACGLGVYSVFRNANAFLDRAIEVPVNPNVRLHSMITVYLGGNGGIVHVVNDLGNDLSAQTGCSASFLPTVTNYP
jgi:hypothetical protein